MLFFWHVKEKNGCSVGGHNCTDFCYKDGCLIINGYDQIVDYEGDYVRQYWREIYKDSDIESVDFQPMKDDFDFDDH